jgi:hypothetical protein
MPGDLIGDETPQRHTGALASGTARLLRSWSARLVVLLGAANGFFFFCYPQLWAESGRTTPFWAVYGFPSWIVCTVVIFVNAAAPLLVIWIVFVLLERTRPATRNGASRLGSH